MSSAQLKRFATVKPADIEWRNGLPYSKEFNDVYFSIHGAVEESQHVFIDGNDLREDWKQRQKNQFYIAELGFGSGLNFFNTANNWHNHLSEQVNLDKQGPKHANQHLHYIAIEKRPFSLADFKKTCQLWPQFSKITKELIQNYPSQSYGRHQIHFQRWNMTLTLMLMPLKDAFEDLIKESKSQQNKIKIDHWYLDGFTPTKNTSMWGDENAKNIAKLSKFGSKLATYSVAGSVKRPLVKAGFKIVKRKGFAKKREMLTAVLQKTYIEKAVKFVNIKYQTPWFNLSKTKFNEPPSEERIAIIGAGIAGCTTAFTLSQKGFHCDVFEANSNVAQAASGAAAGIFHPQLTSDMNISSQFNWLAYMALLRFLSNFSDPQKADILLSTGVQRFLENEESAKKIFELSDSLGLNHWIKRSDIYPAKHRCINFPHSAVVDMAAYCQLLLNKIPKKQLKININTKIDAIHPDNNGWIISSEQANYHYKQVIFCGGAKSQLLKPLNITAINTTRGQTCYFESDKLSKKIKRTICEQSYLVPQKNKRFQLGTTFEDFDDDQLNIKSQKEMLSRTSKFLKEIGTPHLSQQEINSIKLDGTVGYRLHSSDRMPLVGPAIDQNKLTKDFNHLGQKRILSEGMSDYNLPGLWINTAYGSHGLLYSLLASQHLSCLIANDISPLQNPISNALHPARFLIRALKST